MGKKILSVCLGLGFFAALLPVINHLFFSLGERVKVVNPAGAEVVPAGKEIKIVALNIAKGFAHRGGRNFDGREAVRARLDAIAKMLREADPDVVMLSEALWACGPCPINQVAYLAEHTELKHYAFGENCNVGLPFYRIVGGNAVLSKYPLIGIENQSLPGTQPVYRTRNNRKALWCSMDVGGAPLWLAAVHNDSFDAPNRLAQLNAELDFCVGHAAVIAGDFNAAPGSPCIAEMAARSEEFVGVYDGPATGPPNGRGVSARIDWVFAPAEWELVEDRVVSVPESDHEAVVAVFRFGKPGAAGR